MAAEQVQSLAPRLLAMYAGDTLQQTNTKVTFTVNQSVNYNLLKNETLNKIQHHPKLFQKQLDSIEELTKGVVAELNVSLQRLIPRPTEIVNIPERPVPVPTATASQVASVVRETAFSEDLKC